MSVHTFFFNQVVKGERFIFKGYHLLQMLSITTWKVKRKMRALPKEGVGRDLFVILNGPSLKTQDLLLLKGKDLMFVNRGFMHPLYKDLQPKYHVFVDSKLRDGQWPIEWIDKIFELSPGIRIILPIAWYNNKRFMKYRDDSRFFWQYWTVPYYVLGVSGGCFSYGISQKFDNIFFTGFDANGCAYDIINSSENSHFYGGDPELHNMSTKQHGDALFTTSLHYRDLNDFARYCIDNNINIYNLTNGGVLDMFQRRSFENPYSL